MGGVVRSSGVPSRAVIWSVLFVMDKLSPIFSSGSQVADWALLGRRPNTSMLASQQVFFFLPCLQGGVGSGVSTDYFDNKALVSTAAFAAGWSGAPILTVL